MNKLRALRKTNRQLSKKLDYINKPIYLDISMYLLASRLYIEKIEETKQDILYIMLEAQEQGITFDKKVGLSVSSFCDQIEQNSIKKTYFESFLEFFRISATIFTVSTIGFLIVSPSIVNKLSLLFSGQEIPLYLPTISLIYLIVYPYLIFLLNMYVPRILIPILHSRRHTRIIISVCNGASVFIFLLISSFLIGQNAIFSISLLHILIVNIISFFTLIITNIWILYLRKKHIELTIVQQ
ncbi:hypothetical protein [Amedibacillus sp. YH-ame10]